MAYQSLIVSNHPFGITITLNRVAKRNALNRVAINELHQVLDQAENNAQCRIIILEGQQGVFCTGMDFADMLTSMQDQKEMQTWVAHYMHLLHRFTISPKIIIAKVDGQVMAGGIGLIAASDFVIATPQSQFCLPEALWGLLPANVLPYLIRRIGFQKAYLLTLTTQTISGQEAHAMHLVDEVSDQIDTALHKQLLRLSRLNEETVKELKQYFQKLWIIQEETQRAAIQELVHLLNDARVQQNISQFVDHGKFPWE